mmetsp:Transcript_27638/g.82942  ORF Transcript_27638/g.82942 Transcript_27638/m.82942 type:complete len:393 (-) Transcript_27638:36-1214(-)
MEAQLDQVAALGDPKAQTAQYKALIDGLAQRGDAGGLRAALTRLLSDAVPQAVSRTCVAHWATAAPNAGGDLCEWALQQIAPQVQSFEDADAALRNALYDKLVGEGAFREAACALAALNVETSARRYEDAEKAALYVKIAETFLEDDESVDAETFVSRASGLMHAVPQADWALHLRYRVTLARTLDARRKFLDAAMRYYELSQARHAGVDADELVALLAKAMTCALLGNAGPQRARLLTLLAKDERVDSLDGHAEFSAHGTILKRTVTGQLVSHADVAAFTATLMPHQKALLSDGLTIPESAMIQHNLVAVSHIYVNASIAEVAKLLDVEPRRAEAVASRMIAAGRLGARLDQVDGLLHFTDDAGPLVRFDDAIARVCLAVNACFDEVTKEA